MVNRMVLGAILAAAITVPMSQRWLNNRVLSHAAAAGCFSVDDGLYREAYVVVHSGIVAGALPHEKPRCR
jgi:hypothetical protein